jgi:hypothetical protein
MNNLNITFGPSKEELQRYWVSNREHFEALAKYYKEKDPKFYNEYIAPFYSNQPVTIRTAKIKSRTPIRIVIASVLAAFIIGAGLIAYFLVSNQSSVSEKKIQKSETKKSEQTVPNKNAESFKSIYIKGLTFLSDKEYDSAEYYLKLVPQNDPDYKSAQQVLESIGYLKKYDKK